MHGYVFVMNNSGHLNWAVILDALFECHDVLSLGKSRIKSRQCPDMIIAVYWDVKYQSKETNKHIQIHVLKTKGETL